MPNTNKNRKAVVAAAIEYVQNSGSFLASDGYWSYAVGDDRALRAAVAEVLKETGEKREK